MKSLLITLLLILGFNAASAQWQVVHSGGSQNLAAGCFISDSVGFVISTSGVVLKTSDQGTTWNVQATLPGVFTSICKAGTDTLYAGGNCIYNSVDGGNTWNLVVNLPDTITDLLFFGSKTGFSIVPNITHCVWAGWDYYVDSYYVAKSTDQGATWHSELPIGERTNRFQQINDSVAYFNGGAHVGYPHCMDGWYDVSKRTTDRGLTWAQSHQPPPGNTLFSFINADTGYFIRPKFLPEDQYKIWKTVDGGDTFTQSCTEIPDATVKQSTFINEIDGYLLAAHHIYVTKSNGLAWTNDYSSTVQMNTMFYNRSHLLFALGSGGLILKKHVEESTHSDTVYRVNTDNSKFDFGLLQVNTSLTKQLLVTNTGNISLDLTLASSDPFRISLADSAFENSIHLTLASFRDTTVYIRFAPTEGKRYSDTLLISADSLATIRIPVSGSAFAGLSGDITRDTVICTDTLRIIGDVTILPGVRMTICPGTYVYLTDNFRLNVEGVLKADGTVQLPIRFGYLNSCAYWNGIFVINPDTTDITSLSYCDFPDRSNSPSIHVFRGTLAMDHCSVTNKSGDGIMAGPHSRLLLTNSNILNTSGNAVTCDSCDLFSVQGSDIFNNVHGIVISGGREVLIQNNQVHENTAEGISGISDAVIRGNSIFKNSGGISCSGSYIRIENNKIFYNTKHGIYYEMGDGGCSIIQNLIFNNYNNSEPDTHGIGIYLTTRSTSSPTGYVIGNTICNNAYIGFGTDLFGMGVNGATFNMQVFNNIIDNVAGTNYSVMVWPEVNLTIDYNCIRQTALPGEHNLNADPGFVNPVTSLGIPDIYDYDWSIKGSSPCVNSGDSNQTAFQLPLDFAGLPRVCGNRIDMGAYEYQGPFSVHENERSSDVLVYPNPVAGVLNVVVIKSGSVQFTLNDISGRCVLQETFVRRISVNLEHLTPGIYLYELRDGRGVIKKGKIVVSSTRRSSR
jgi:parallel beta-helix repeat protein